jgi:hypothetical protein
VTTMRSSSPATSWKNLPLGAEREEECRGLSDRCELGERLVAHGLDLLPQLCDPGVPRVRALVEVPEHAIGGLHELLQRRSIVVHHRLILVAPLRKRVGGGGRIERAR